MSEVQPVGLPAIFDGPSSNQINDLAKALSAAQGNWVDQRVLLEVVRLMHKRTRYSDPARLLFNHIYALDSECWLWFGSIDALGYGRVGPRKSTWWENKAHRLSWRLFFGDIPEGLKVLHKCDVRNCVNPEHLFLGTQKDNVQDMISKGRRHTNGPQGESNARAKLTDDQVRHMRSVRQSTGLSHRKIAAQFGVSTMTAYRACEGQCWRHI